MSWISGEFVINDMTEKTLKKAYSSLSSAVRHNADLEEFPYMGTDIMKIKPFHKGKIYGSQEEASKALRESYASWAREYNVAAAFYDTSAAKETKRIKTLKERLEREHQKLNDYIKKNDCKNFKAKLITCPKCESKINKKYILRNMCPLCKHDLRSKTVIETTQRYQNNIQKLSDEICQENLKQKEKLPVRYLVGYCEHIG